MLKSGAAMRHRILVGKAMFPLMAALARCRNRQFRVFGGKFVRGQPAQLSEAAFASPTNIIPDLIRDDAFLGRVRKGSGTPDQVRGDDAARFF